MTLLMSQILIQKGADPELPLRGSYGGYAVLAGLTFTPGVARIDYVGVSIYLPF